MHYWVLANTKAKGAIFLKIIVILSALNADSEPTEPDDSVFSMALIDRGFRTVWMLA